MIEKSPMKISVPTVHCNYFLIGKHAHQKGNIRHVRSWSKSIVSNFSCFFLSKLAKMSKHKGVYPQSDDFVTLLSIRPSKGII